MFQLCGWTAIAISWRSLISLYLIIDICYHSRTDHLFSRLCCFYWRLFKSGHFKSDPAYFQLLGYVLSPLIFCKKNLSYPPTNNTTFLSWFSLYNVSECFDILVTTQHNSRIFRLTFLNSGALQLGGFQHLRLSSYKVLPWECFILMFTHLEDDQIKKGWLSSWWICSLK